MEVNTVLISSNVKFVLSYSLKLDIKAICTSIMVKASKLNHLTTAAVSLENQLPESVKEGSDLVSHINLAGDIV